MTTARAMIRNLVADMDNKEKEEELNKIVEEGVFKEAVSLADV